MARSRCAHRMGLLVSLVAPLDQLCEQAALHLRDGVGALCHGGWTIGEWLELICPHGLVDGWIVIHWREGPDRLVAARIHFDAGGEARLDGVDVAAEPTGRARYGYAADASLAVLSLVESSEVPYSLGQAMAWALSLGQGGGVPLGGGAPAAKPHLMATDAQDMAAMDGRDTCESGTDPERNADGTVFFG